MHRMILALSLFWFTALTAWAMPLDIEADYLEKSGNRVEARGNVVVTGQDLEIRANHVVYDRDTFDLWATGDCYAKEKDTESRAATLHFNTRRNDLFLANGSLMTFSDPLNISGSIIRRYGHEYYTGDDIEFTTCLSTDPDWSMRAGSIEIPVEGYGSLRHARLQIKDIPVLYIPYVWYPAKLERQSGLLFPEVGHSSDMGYHYGQPLFITLGNSSDLTLTPHWLSRRGMLLAGQFRYRLDYDTRGEIYIEALHDEKGGDLMEGGLLDYIPSERWLFKARHNGGDLNWNINLVSHEDYFRDIGTMYAEDGDSISRDASSDDLENLVSRIGWTKSGGGFSVGLSSQWKQDLTVRGDDMTKQELPRLKLRMSQRDLPRTPLKYTAEMSSVRVYTRDWISALKNDAMVEMSMPVNFAPYINIRPYLQTLYRDTNLTENTAGYKHYNHTDGWTWEDKPYARDEYAEHWQKRGVSLTTTLYSPRFLDGLYHQVTPGMTWSYKSRLEGNLRTSDPLYAREIFPDLLTGDAWTKECLTSFSLANDIRDDSGDAIMNLNLSRSYDHITGKWDLASVSFKLNPTDWLTLEHKNEFGRSPREGLLTDIYGATILGDNLYSLLTVSPQLNRYSLKRSFATHENSTSIKIKDGRGDEFRFGAEYNRTDTNSITAGLDMVIGHGFSAWMDLKYDYIKRNFEFVREGVRYKSQCWSVDLYAEVDPRDDYYTQYDIDRGIVNYRATEPREVKLNLRINLLGLGDVVTTSYKFEDDDTYEELGF